MERFKSLPIIRILFRPLIPLPEIIPSVEQEKSPQLQETEEETELNAPEGTFSKITEILDPDQDNGTIANARRYLYTFRWSQPNSLFVLHIVNDGIAAYPKTRTEFVIDSKEHVSHLRVSRSTSRSTSKELEAKMDEVIGDVDKTLTLRSKS